MAKSKTLQNRHFLNFSIAGFTYWEGCLVLDKLKLGVFRPTSIRKTM